MKANELKTKLQKSGEDLINVYFNDNTLVDKITNSTLKAMLKANITKIDGVLEMFADKDGNIDAEGIIESYAEQLTNGLEIDIKKYIKSSFICDLLPNKSVIIKKDDVLNIIKENPKPQQIIPLNNHITTIQ